MHQPLSLKYRPKNLASLVGQEPIKIALTNAVTSAKIAPAYLFTGPRGTGKTSTARILAKSLNCLNSSVTTANPCQKCASCKAIDAGNSLDVSEIDAASHNGVEDARELIERSNFAPAMSRYRIFVLDECHQLSSSAQNALLKCIEEPPSHVVFILCTTEAHKVLPTISSRCQTFNFKALSMEAIVEQLSRVAVQESIAITEEANKLIAKHSEGGLRDALQLLSQLSLMGEEITLERVVEVSGGIRSHDLATLVKAICAGDVLTVLQSARTLIDSGKTPKLILSSLLAVYRDLLIVKSVPKSENILAGTLSYSQLRQVANTLDFPSIDAALMQLQKSESQLRVTTNGATWLEVCLLNLIHNNQRQLLGNQEQHNRNGNGKVEELSSVWMKVVEATKPANRSLLSRAKLISLNESNCVLVVPTSDVKKFQSNVALVERIVSRVLGYSVTIAIEERKELSV
ncbi:DNA polymerase III, subunit gamma and tau [[Phormidium ambiguum] IAM M-71]|uniref:DNA polymerase III subunit gamma/tau n=1 Tax=[Phormidium ambiguum] IAM M-71 TaxID=454136 RepID=A0A1U7I9F0_9CYAN|nr:DNA polymerase III subunit gamma/tau [Phormidium ambiguum]OKH33141.1 DNA polymerase III, subunit gamma and tau [Phormidium ambiguum IAM M-71]